MGSVQGGDAAEGGAVSTVAQEAQEGEPGGTHTCAGLDPGGLGAGVGGRQQAPRGQRGAAGGHGRAGCDGQGSGNKGSVSRERRSGLGTGRQGLQQRNSLYRRLNRPPPLSLGGTRSLGAPEVHLGPPSGGGPWTLSTGCAPGGWELAREEGPLVLSSCPEALRTHGAWEEPASHSSELKVCRGSAGPCEGGESVLASQRRDPYGDSSCPGECAAHPWPPAAEDTAGPVRPGGLQRALRPVPGSPMKAPRPGEADLTSSWSGPMPTLSVTPTLC